MERVVRETARAAAPGDLAGEQGPRGAVHVADRELDGDRLGLIERVPGLGEDLVVDVVVEPPRLRRHEAPGPLGGHVRLGEDRVEVELGRFPVGARAGREALGAPHHLVERAEPEARHVAADVLGDEHEEVDDVVGLAGEALAQLGILGCDSDGAGVEVALAQHDAALGDERRGGHPELLGAEQRADDHVAAGAHPAVDLHPDAVAQLICTSTCWVSASPSSHGSPACLMLDTGEAPVPPE